MAKVRYDFSARDRSELSMREGDTVKIISKKAHNGWWKGEVYGRVSVHTHLRTETNAHTTHTYESPPPHTRTHARTHTHNVKLTSFVVEVIRVFPHEWNSQT